MAKRRFVIDPEPKMDMTPMIDIVFLLIVFFMVVSEIASADVEKIDLPFASEAEKSDQAKKRGEDVDKMLQVNVMATGLIKVRGRTMVADAALRQEKHIWLPEFLEIEAAAYEREPPEPGQAGTPPSALRINIRADANSPFKYVQQVFDACVRQGIYKTSLAATQDDPSKSRSGGS